MVLGRLPKPYKFPSLERSQKRFPWTHKEVDLAPHPVAGLVLQVQNVEKFPQALDFERLGSSVNKQGTCFTAMKGDGGNNRFVQLELAA